MVEPVKRDSKYVQNRGNCSHPWKEKPEGSSWKKTEDSKCWLCAKGCAVLCILALKDLDPNEKNIKANINKKADCFFGGYNGTEESYPCIAKVDSKTSDFHYIIIENEDGTVWDPSGGKTSTIKSYKIHQKYYKE